MTEPDAQELAPAADQPAGSAAPHSSEADAGLLPEQDMPAEAKPCQDAAAAPGATSTSDAAPGSALQEKAEQAKLPDISEGTGPELTGPQEAGSEETGQTAAPAARPAGKLPATVRVAFKVARGFCLAVLSLIVLFLAALLGVQWNMDSITSLALREVYERTGCEVTFTDVAMNFFPLPAIRLDNVQLHYGGKPDGQDSTAAQSAADTAAKAAADLQVQVRTIAFAPNFLTLLSGRFEPEIIVLDRPEIRGTLPVAIRDLTGAASGTGSEEPQDLSGILPMHCKLRIDKGRIELWDRDGNFLDVRDFSTRLSLTNLPMKNPLNGLDGSLSLGWASVQTRDFAAVAADVSIEGATSLENPLADCDVRLEARTAISPMSFGMATSVRLANGTLRGAEGSGTIKGSFAFDGTVIPYEITGSLKSAKPGTGELRLVPEDSSKSFAAAAWQARIATIALGDDRLNFEGFIAADMAAPAVTGRLGIETVSLTRWLTFARNLSPGLQHALNKVTDGAIDFYLNSSFLTAPAIRATAGGATFTGKGGIADWKNIEVFLDMSSDFVDLGVAIPESTGNMPEPLTFPHKPLNEITAADIFGAAPAADTTPASEARDAEGARGAKDAKGAGTQKAAASATDGSAKAASPGAAAGKAAAEGRKLSYDIRLGARKIHYGYIDISNGGVIIHPGTNSAGSASARLDMKAGIYDGTCSGYAHFSGTTETEYEFAIDTAGVNLKKLHKAIDFVPFTSGTGKCRVRVTSRGSEVHRFLANLRGRVEVTGTSAVMAKAERFSPMTIDCDLRLSSGAFRNSSLGLNGNWDVAVRGSSGWSGTIQMPGMVWFGGQAGSAGVRLDNLAAKISAKRTEKLIPAFKAENVAMELQGKASLDTSKSVVRMSSGHYVLPGTVCDGAVEATLDSRNPRLTGNFSKVRLHVPEAARLIRTAPLSVPSFMEHMTATNVRMDLTQTTLRLQHFATTVDKTSVQGELAMKYSTSLPSFTFNLHAGNLDVDSYLGDSPKGAGAAAGGQETTKRWDFSALADFDAKGTLRMDRLRVKKTTLTGLQLPITLEHGQLSLPSLKGTVYGGSLSGRASVDFRSGVAFNSSLKVTQFDLGDMFRDRETKAIFTGKADFSAMLSSAMRGPGELARNLHGRVSFQAGRGSYQALDKNMRPSGKPTHFGRVGSTGQISGGILRTSDFVLVGPELQLTGKGWIDLGKETMDMDFVADLNNLPRIPVRLYGTFENPKTDIKGGMAILNAIGGIFTGIFGLVGDLLSGVMGAFR